MEDSKKFCFIECSGRSKKPSGSQFTILRRHIMHEHLRKHPRPKRRLASTSLQVSTRTPLGIARTDSQGAFDGAGSSSSSSGHTRDDFSTTLATRLDLAVVPTPNLLSSQIRIQARATFNHLYCPRGSTESFFDTDPGSLAGDTALLPAIISASDALCLILIGTELQDRRVLLHAIACYRRALAHTNHVIAKFSETPLPAGVIATIYYLAKYETIAGATLSCSDSWIHHARAYVNLLSNKTIRDGLPKNSAFRKILRDGFFNALSVGLITKRWSGPVFSDLRTILDPRSMPLYEAVHRVPNALMRLHTMPTLLRDRRDKEFESTLIDALTLWQAIDAEFTALQDKHPNWSSIAEFQDFPIFYAKIGDEFSSNLQFAYSFAHAHLAIMHRTARKTLIALGGALLSKLMNASFMQDAILEGLSWQQSLCRQDIKQALQAGVDMHAEALCRMFPYMTERMQGLGLSGSSSVNHLLRRYYSYFHQHTLLGSLRLGYLEKIQNSLLFGPKIERVLCTV